MGRRTALNQISHDLCRDGGQKDAVAKMAGSGKYARCVGRADDGQTVRRAGTQSRPSLNDGSGGERRKIFCGGRDQLTDDCWIYRFVKSHILHGRADQGLTGAAGNKVHLRGAQHVP